MVGQVETADFARTNNRWWRIYVCKRCGGVTLAGSRYGYDKDVTESYPGADDIDSAIPERAREYLSQAASSLSAPVGAVMLCASAVDAMLKAKGLSKGSLYGRIDEAAETNVITADMAKWAHAVRLDANDQRHSDETAPLPTAVDAQRSLDFALALANLLFVLPSRVTRGIEDAQKPA